METSQLRQLISTFSPNEKKEIKRFLESPFFNSRKDVVQLFDWFCENASPEKETAKRHLFGPVAVPDQELRLRMTYLTKLLERYLAQKEFEAEENAVQLRTVTGFRRRGLSKHFERARTKMDKSLETNALRDEKYHEMHFRLNWENYQMRYAENQAELESLRSASQSADVAYLAQKLRLICLAESYNVVYSVDYQSVWENDVVGFAEKNFAQKHPAIGIYLLCRRMLRSPENEQHFLDFKKMLLENAALFSADETRSLFIWAINFCVRRLNAGEKRFFPEVTELYKAGLESGVLLENGVLTPYIYANVVAAGLQTADLDWVNFFIHHYKNNLEKSHRESAFSFNLARLEFARRRFQAVLELLQKANYRDPLLNLSAKTLLLKTWYELGELDILQNHLDAMRNFIHRKSVLGYHRTNYLKLIKYTDKLLSLNRLNAKAVEKLRGAVLVEEHLPEKEWLLAVV